MRYRVKLGSSTSTDGSGYRWFGVNGKACASALPPQAAKPVAATAFSRRRRVGGADRCSSCIVVSPRDAAAGRAAALAGEPGPGSGLRVGGLHRGVELHRMAALLARAIAGSLAAAE